ncbi:MAG: SDR family oxidoreductase [Streptosporangiales bacterium]|nr:SDR family oxidoreductase [Streptosporangiales bacterium]
MCFLHSSQTFSHADNPSPGTRGRVVVAIDGTGIRGKVAVVTGIGRNIGEAIAERFVQEGVRVVGADIDGDRAKRVSERLEAIRAGTMASVVCDTSNGEQVEGLVRTAVDTWGRVDILVNNVAVTDRSTVFDLSEDEWDRVMSVTLKSTFLCTKFVAAQMKAQGDGGAIVNIASTSGHLGRRDATAYPAAKAAILNLSRTLAIQLAPYRIRVNVVTPNRVGSPVGMDESRHEGEVRNLVGRNGRPEDVAAAVAFLAGAEATFVDGAELLVDGGAVASLEP